MGSVPENKSGLSETWDVTNSTEQSMLSIAQFTNRGGKRGQATAARSPIAKGEHAVSHGERVRMSHHRQVADNAAPVTPADSGAAADAPAAGEIIAQYLERLWGERKCRRTFAW